MRADGTLRVGFDASFAPISSTNQAGGFDRLAAGGGRLSQLRPGMGAR